MRKIMYSLSWSTNENESYLEKYYSLIKWLLRIMQLFKQGHSVLIYKPHKE